MVRVDVRIVLAEASRWQYVSASGKEKDVRENGDRVGEGVRAGDFKATSF